MSTYGEATVTGRTVIDEAKARLRRCYEEADVVVVSFSGGKDSTAVLGLAIEVATEMGRLPVEVLFCDEEILQPELIAYVRRVYKRPDINMVWSCIPTKQRNAGSMKEPWWYTWHPDSRDLWVRELPPEAVTGEDRPEIPQTGLRTQMPYLYPVGCGTVIEVLGRRSQESLTRHKMIAQRRGRDAFLSKPRNDAKWVRRADPIYDMKTVDVWTLIKNRRWDYCRVYDMFTALGMTAHSQRIAVPTGEEGGRNLDLYASCWPELFLKVQGRLPGLDVLRRYGKTAAYAIRSSEFLRPEIHETWEEYVMRLIEIWPKEDRFQMLGAMKTALLFHDRKTDGRPLPETKDDPVSGICWLLLARIAFRGTLKRRSLTQVLYGRPTYVPPPENTDVILKAEAAAGEGDDGEQETS